MLRVPLLYDDKSYVNTLARGSSLVFGTATVAAHYRNQKL